jgi:hypothetical protein
MIKLQVGNVLLKPSHRKQLMSWLRRALRIGSRLGEFMLVITMHRSGRQCEVRATVHDTAGDFVCRSRQHDWRDAMRDLIRSLVNQLHAQQIHRAAIA